MLSIVIGLNVRDVHCACDGHRYWTLAEPYTLEVEIKKSRFITSAWPVKTPAEVGRDIRHNLYNALGCACHVVPLLDLRRYTFANQQRMQV